LTARLPMVNAADMHSDEYRVRAHNTATQSENKIHDDAVAKQFGFRGGLVPGVDVYAYLTHPIVARWGRAWLERGTVSVRFSSPVYDGEEVCVSATADGDALAVAAHNPAGTLCASARATLPADAPLPPSLAAYPSPGLPADPPPASPAALPPDLVLGAIESGFRAAHAVEYLTDVRESLPLYRELGIAHPGYLLRQANFVLAANVRLGPWIHVASTVQNFSLATDGDRIGTRARVAAAYEKKGHRFVDLDVLLLANDTRPLAQVAHTAIYEPRRSGTSP
jgi:acyl dehydratase